MHLRHWQGAKLASAEIANILLVLQKIFTLGQGGAPAPLSPHPPGSATGGGVALCLSVEGIHTVLSLAPSFIHYLVSVRGKGVFVNDIHEGPLSLHCCALL